MKQIERFKLKGFFTLKLTDQCNWKKNQSEMKKYNKSSQNQETQMECVFWFADAQYPLERRIISNKKVC
jgi:hypothetical protein